MAENSAIAVPVLGNDLDPDSSFVLVGFTQPVNGIVLLVGADLVYTPNSGYWGADSFTYEISDGAAADTATVDVTVTSSNGAPVAERDGVFSATEDVPYTLSPATLLANDSDPDSTDTLTIETVTQPRVGSLTMALDGQLLYTPEPEFSGSVQFTYIVRDQGGLLSQPALVEIDVAAVDDPPAAVDDVAATSEDEPIAIDVLANDVDIDSALVTVAASTPLNGSLMRVGRELVYTPDTDFAGTDSFEYTVSDGTTGPTSTASVTVTVTGVPDAPVAVDDAETTDEDVPIVADVLSNDFDVDSPLTIVAMTQPANGTATQTIGGITYQPSPDFNGTDSFTYTLDDGAASMTATVSIEVRPVNDTPIAADDPISTDEDTAVLIDVLANDTDVDVDDSLFVVSFTQPTSGTVLQIGDRFEYQPSADFAGSDSFDYVVSDASVTDGATVVIAVIEEDDAPVAIDDGPLTTQEDTTLVIEAATLLANDFDRDPTDEIAIFLMSQPHSGTVSMDQAGDFLYVPNADYFGPDSLTYVVSDLAGNTSTPATVMVEVTPVDEPPRGGNDGPWQVDENGPPTVSVSILVANLLSNDIDPDTGDVLTIEAVDAGSSDGTALYTPGDQAIVFTPRPYFSGPTTFTYKVCDQTNLCDVAVTVDIEVQAKNDPPTAPDHTYQVSAVGPITTSGVLAAVTDEGLPNDTLSITSATVVGGGLSTATPSASGSEVNYSPAPGTTYEEVKYVVTDGFGLTASGVIRFTITNVNPPIIAAPTKQFAGRGDTFELTLAATDADPGDAVVSWTATNLPPGLSIDPATGVISGQVPSDSPDLPYLVTVTATDTTQLTNTAAFTIEVAQWGSSPLAGKLAITEVRYNETRNTIWNSADAGVLDEFVEFTNVSNDVIDLAGVGAMDFNRKDGGADRYFVDSLDYFPTRPQTTYDEDVSFSGKLVDSGLTSLAPGETIVYWMRTPDDGSFSVRQIDFTLTPFPNATAATGEMANENRWPLMDRDGDEVWLVDEYGVIDFVSWESSSPSGDGDNLSPPPGSHITDFTPGNRLALGDAAPGQSISLADYGRPGDPTCWERTGSGTASCAGATTTLDLDTVWTPENRISSAGRKNTP